MITDVQYTPGAGGGVLRIEGEKFLFGATPEDVQVVFTIGNKEIEVPGPETLGIGDSIIDVQVPDTVILGMADITVERRQLQSIITPDNSGGTSTSWLTSQPVYVINPGGYGFIMAGVGGEYALKVIDIQNINETEPEQVVKEIPLADTPWRAQTVPTTDRTRVYVTGNEGVYVVDAVTLQLHDVNPETDALDVIQIPGGTSALAIDPDERYLFAASGDNVHIIDLRGGSDTFHQILETISNVGTPYQLISKMAVNADGSKLFLTAPATTYYGGVQSYTSGGRERGKIFVININDGDRPENGQPGGPQKWRQVIGVLDGGVEPRDIKATSDPNKMVFASYLTNWRGFGTIQITNPNPVGFSATIGLWRCGLSIPANSSVQKYDLDIQNTSSVVVTPDLAYGFALDWYHPNLFQRDLDQLIRDNLRELGTKVGVIRDPFGLNGQPTYLGATSPIPLGFGEGMRLSSDGRKLYANYRGTGDVLVFDVKKLIEKIESLQNVQSGAWPILSRQPVDRIEGIQVNLPGIPVGGLARGLSLQVNDPLELIAPQGVFGGVGQDMTFEWEVDKDLIGEANYEVRLYVSTQQQGFGIWPDDPARRRNEPELPFVAAALFGSEFDTDPSWNGEDGNPTRIYTSDWMSASEAEESGEDFDSFEEIVSSEYSELLTAGNRYYWGVELKLADQTFRRVTSFVTAPETEQTVTVLTHGFQFGFSVGDDPYQQPEAFMEMADLIRNAAGGGVILSYNKNTGEWVDRENGVDPVSAINGGQSVVLVSDWFKESDISDSGFSEAAADAMFASLAELNRQTGNKLLNAHLHFIGHSRGTVVNSEIIQRIGRWYPTVQNIHMTTLDPHDFEQKSLNVPVGEKIDSIKSYLQIGAAVSTVIAAAFPPTAPVLLPAAAKMTAAANTWRKP